jgi:hypothetical protein
MLRALLPLAAAAVLAGGAASASASAAAAAPATPSDAVDALYVINTSGGSYDGHTLTLRGVAPSVAWFADRPARVSGVEGMAAATRQLFSGARPNAAFDIAGGDDRVHAVTLSQPRYDVRSHTLRYRATALASLSSTKLAHLEERRTRAGVPRSFAAASLFIDDGEVSTSGDLDGLTPLTDADIATKVIAASADRPVIVGVCSATNPQCQYDYIPVLAQVAAQRNGRATFYFVDPAQAPNFVAQQGLGSSPTTLFFSNGAVVSKVPGTPSATTLIGDVDWVLAGS